MALASLKERGEGDLDTFPAQERAWYLIGIPEGSARITCEMGCLYLSAGQALAVCAESPVDILFHGTGSYVLFCFKGTLPGTILRPGAPSGGTVYRKGAPVLASIWEKLCQEESSCGSVTAQCASGIAYQALMALYGSENLAVVQEKQLPQVVEAALKLLQQDFAFLDGIGDLAQRLQVSQEYLTRIFREYVGITPGKYLVQVRVEQAKLLLQQGEHSIAFVADACGFTNSNYFARVFRSTVGLTPSAYAREQSKHHALPHSMLDSIYVL